MSDLLVQTKLFIPAARPARVARRRLMQLLDDGLRSGHRLTLVSAPAGSGKTTLLSDWAAHADGAVAWLSLDAGDSDPARFWTAVVAAVQRARPGAGLDAHQFLDAPVADPGLAVASVLCNDLTAVPERTTIVLDDYHTIAAREVHAAVAFLVERLPPQAHLALATRADPPLPLARLRARALLTELRATDLRFTRDETAAFLTDCMGLALDPADVAALEARTEGWIVGLQLAALSLQGRSDVAGFVRAFAGTHHYILEYLTDEVLGQQRPSVQRFLAETSILERLCGPLCEAVTGEADGAALLDELQRANLFVIALDDARYWFRYHHLFASLLGNHLRRTASPDHIAGLHRRAAHWHEANDLPADAVRHALAAGDADHAGQLLERFALDFLTRGELTTLLGWLDALPQAAVLGRPLLSITRAWALAFAGRVGEVAPLLQGAEAGVAPGDQGPTGRIVLASAALIRALIADMAGEVSRAIELAERAARDRDALPPMTASLIPHILGRAHRSDGNFEAALAAFDEIARLGEAAGNIWTTSVALRETATVRTLQGRLSDAEALYRRVQCLASERRSAHYGTLAMADAGMADVLRERNDLGAAQQRAERALEQLRVWRNPTDLLVAWATLARIRLAQGNPAAAREALEQADEVRRAAHVYVQVHAIVEAAWVLLWLAEGRLDEAVRWADAPAESRDAPGALGGRMMAEARQILQARVWIADGRPDQALALLDRLAGDIESGGRMGRAIEIDVHRAAALQQRGAEQPALDALGRALVRAAPEGAVRVFLDGGGAIAGLLQTGQARGVWDTRGSAEFVQALRAAFGGAERDAANAGLIEPLTARELEVLRLIAAGRSNNAIANELVVTLNTVKKHTSNIYGKLGVTNRTLAAARARELALIE